MILEGASSLSGAVYFYGGSELENEGVLTLGAGVDLVSQDGNASNRLVNDSGATVTFATSGQGATVGVTATNGGTVSATSGTLTFGAGRWA